MDNSKQIRDVILTRQPIELFKVLKFEGLAGTGGEAKHLIADGRVLVNGEKELRKSRKIVAGDIIELGKDVMRMASRPLG